MHASCKILDNSSLILSLPHTVTRSRSTLNYNLNKIEDDDFNSDDNTSANNNEVYRD